jgi:hypothetical protein
MMHPLRLPIPNTAANEEINSDLFNARFIQTSMQIVLPAIESLAALSAFATDLN